MPDTDAVTSTIQNQLPPRTTNSHRWPRKWATLGGRGSTLPPQMHLNDNEKMNGNGHRHTTSLFRKSSTISRTNGVTLTTENSLTKSRSLINVLRSKLNSPAVLRRFRTKSRESSKQVVTEIQEIDEKKSRKRDPSPMKRFTSRLAQLTRSSTHTSIETSNQRQKSSSPPSSAAPPPPTTTTTHNQDQVDHINACYDEIRAKYLNNNNSTKQTSTLSALSQHPCAPLPTDRLRDMLSTTTTSSVDYYDRPHGEIHNRSLSTISMNGSLLSHDFLNNSQALSTSPPKTTVDDPALQARKQSNIKLNCMLSGYGFKTPFGNLDKNEGEHDLFKFHHYHDVGKRKFDWNTMNTNNTNRLYSSLRTRPMSRSIDNFRRATTTIETSIDELVIREDSDSLTCSSTVHVQPAVSLQVKTFISSTSKSNNNDDEFEKNFLRAVDRALGGVCSKDNQPLYDTPMKIEEALSNFKHTDFLPNDERKEEQNDDEHQTNGTESPNVELFDRTGELLNTDNIQWQTSAVYDQQEESNPIVCSVVDDLTRKTQDLIYDEPQNGRDFITKLDEEERMIKSKADVYNKLLQSDDNRLTDEIRSDINAAIGEVNLLLRGKLKQFRGLCQANVMKSTTSAGEPTPLDSDLEGFWDITYPLIDKVKVKFAKLDVQKAKQWAPIEDEYDPNDVNNRPRIIDDRLKQLQPHQNKTKITNMKTGNDDLKKLIQERRKAAANASNQNHDVEIFVAQK